ncbi:hypothetical protein [Salipaludibacillus sp. CF4.18]|uniref:hypothetical protein n=1 Tax=Salipaludibacillus sp. CF4.18 TaxID=3373081 RepID=UPI003EE66D77
MHDNDIDYMTSAYKVLYEIETLLKYNIHSTFYKRHGLRWEEFVTFKKPLEIMFFRDVLTLYLEHPLFKNYFDNEEIILLLNLRPIRNDIAHMKVITTEEYDLLIKCCHIVKQKKCSDQKRRHEVLT